MELKMQRFVFSVVSSLWEMRRIEKVKEKIKETFMTPKGDTHEHENVFSYQTKSKKKEGGE